MTEVLQPKTPEKSETGKTQQELSELKEQVQQQISFEQFVQQNGYEILKLENGESIDPDLVVAVKFDKKERTLKLPKKDYDIKTQYYDFALEVQDMQTLIDYEFYTQEQYGHGDNQFIQIKYITNQGIPKSKTFYFTDLGFVGANYRFGKSSVRNVVVF